MLVALSSVVLAAEQPARGDVAEIVYCRVEHVCLNLSPTRERQCGQYALRDLVRCQHICDGVADLGRRAISLAGDVHHARHGLDGQVERWLVRKHTVTWKTRNRRMNELIVDAREVLESEPQLLLRFRWEVADEHAALLNELVDDLLACLLL